MISGALLAAWLGGFGLRGSGKFVMQGEVMRFVDQAKTEADRREELIPVTMRQDCEAFVELEGGDLWFCIARGDIGDGALPIVERVPWDSFSNFEEGSHKQWFRGRVAVSDMADWGVIIAQSSTGRVVKVAESVHEQAWLVELLVTLQNTFIAPREAMIRQMREAAQATEQAKRKPSDPSTTEQHSVPKKKF